jgi:hypothetical protein
MNRWGSAGAAAAEQHDGLAGIQIGAAGWRKSAPGSAPQPPRRRRETMSSTRSRR